MSCGSWHILTTSPCRNDHPGDAEGLVYPFAAAYTLSLYDQNRLHPADFESYLTMIKRSELGMYEGE